MDMQRDRLDQTCHEDLLACDLRALRHLQRGIDGSLVAAPWNNYIKVWVRDNLQIAYSLFVAGEWDFASEITSAINGICLKHRWKIDYRLRDGRPSSWGEMFQAIHSVYDIYGNEFPYPWGHLQNDAIGLILLTNGTIGSKIPSLVTPEVMNYLSILPEYLHKMQYWLEDFGTWEEGPYAQLPSDLSCIVGMMVAGQSLGVPYSEEALENGIAQRLSLGHRFSQSREVDLSNLQLYWPLGATDDESIILAIERELVRDHGVIRYHGDSYEISDDGMAMEWPLGFYWLGLSWYMLGDRDKAAYYLERGDSLRLPDGSIPEGYRHVCRDWKLEWAPCPHTPLGWPHGLSIALRSLLGLIPLHPAKVIGSPLINLAT